MELQGNLQYVSDIDSSPLQKYDNTERQNKARDWVIVHYADKYSEDDNPGEVTLVAENEVTVSEMHISEGGFFKWSNHKDELHYLLHGICYCKN